MSLTSPVTRTDRTIGLAMKVPIPVKGFVEVPALTAMMLDGLSTVDHDLAALIQGEGLSTRARQLWPQLRQRSLAELATADSLGGLAGKAMLGRDGKELTRRLLAGLRAADVANVHFARGLPIRIDSAYYDEVQPWWLTTRLANRWQAAGAALTHTRWRASHSTVLDERHAPEPIARWLLRAFQIGSPRR